MFVNGCRIVVSLFVFGIENFVDINSIFVFVVECVEVLVMGVLVIYGVDVVVGVINYIFKNDYEGLEF